MRRCEALKGDGSRCQARAMEGYQWCYSHRPDLAEERKRNARRGGQTGGRGRGARGEIDTAKSYVKGLVSQLIKGEVDRGLAQAAFAGLHVLARLIELERRIKETDELEERIEALERLETTWGRSAWHRR
jgi:hypothetical protein